MIFAELINLFELQVCTTSCQVTIPPPFSECFTWDEKRCPFFVFTVWGYVHKSAAVNPFSVIGDQMQPKVQSESEWMLMSVSHWHTFFRQWNPLHTLIDTKTFPIAADLFKLRKFGTFIKSGWGWWSMSVCVQFIQSTEKDKHAGITEDRFYQFDDTCDTDFGAYTG